MNSVTAIRDCRRDGILVMQVMDGEVVLIALV